MTQQPSANNLYPTNPFKNTEDANESKKQICKCGCPPTTDTVKKIAALVLLFSLLTAITSGLSWYYPNAALIGTTLFSVISFLALFALLGVGIKSCIDQRKERVNIAD